MLRSIKITSDLNRKSPIQSGDASPACGLAGGAWRACGSIPHAPCAHCLEGLAVTQTSWYLTQGLILSLHR